MMMHSPRLLIWLTTIFNDCGITKCNPARGNEGPTTPVPIDVVELGHGNGWLDREPLVYSDRRPDGRMQVEHPDNRGWVRELEPNLAVNLYQHKYPSLNKPPGSGEQDVTQR